MSEKLLAENEAGHIDRRRNDDAEIIWLKVLQIVREHVDDTKFSTWFKPLYLLSGSSGMLRVAAPNKFVRDWVLEHYHGLLVDLLQQITGVPYQVFIVVGEPKAEPALQPEPAAEVVMPPSANSGYTQFNSRFTFETFVVGSSNQFTQAACLAVSRHPAGTYNPLFIYGDVGLGKTHLLHAIGHYVQQHHPHLVTCYVSSEKFLNDLVGALSHDKMEDFRNRYRRNDVILVDDVQFLIGKERTQEEFFHTFNVLFNANKQIVLTSDKLPKAMTGLEKRLQSRFEWGLVTDLQPPDLETKIAILKRKAEYRQFELPDEVVLYIARLIRSDARKLEGALTTVEAFASITGQEITLGLAKSLLGDLAEGEDKPITIAEIERVVAEHYHIKTALLRSKRRHKDIAHARHVAMYLTRQLTDASLPHIGKTFGDRDHTSVIHACNKIKGMLKENWNFQEEVEQLIRVLQS